MICFFFEKIERARKYLTAEELQYIGKKRVVDISPENELDDEFAYSFEKSDIIFQIPKENVNLKIDFTNLYEPNSDDYAISDLDAMSETSDDIAREVKFFMSVNLFFTFDGKF